MRGLKIVRSLTKNKMDEAAVDHLKKQANAQQTRYRNQIESALQRLETRGGNNNVTIGKTSWGRAVSLPCENFFVHSLIVGSNGAGKTYTALQIINEFLHEGIGSIGVLDPKTETMTTAMKYIYAHLYKAKREERETLKKKIVVLDFSDSKKISPYNILAPQADQGRELLVEKRIDAICDVFDQGSSTITSRMKTVLKYLFLLGANCSLTLPQVEKLMDDKQLLDHYVTQCSDERVRDYFRYRYEKEEPEVTKHAVRQRIDSILSSESVRLALSAETAPDFRKLQDEGSIILINTAGRNISRSISELLQILILEDVRQSIFSRQNNNPFLWFFDEAQNFYKAPSAQEGMDQILRMSRSYGSFVSLLTQSGTSAIKDSDAINSLLSNVKILLMFRSTTRDAALIEPAIPVLGNVPKPVLHSRERAQYMTPTEEKRHKLNEINHLPDRQALLWLKGSIPQAMEIKTTDVPQPHEIAACSEKELEDFMASNELGNRIPKEELLSKINKQKEQTTRNKNEQTPERKEDYMKTLEEEFKKKTSGRKQ